MSLALKPALLADIPLLLEMIADFYREEEIPFEAPSVRGALEELLGTPVLGTLQLIMLRGAPIGYAAVMFSFILEFGGRKAFLDELFITHPNRGQGYAREVLRLVEDYVREQGIRILRLEVTRSNSRALALYEKLGFIRHDRFTMTKLLTDEPWPA